MDNKLPELERDEKGYAILPNRDKIKGLPTTIVTSEDGKETAIFWSHYIPAKQKPNETTTNS